MKHRFQFSFNRLFVGPLALMALANSAGAATGAEDRAYSVQVLVRIAEPVLVALSEGELHSRMPVRAWEKSRAHFALLEACARTLAGVAPWIALGADETEEGRLRARFSELARRALINATDPKSPDFCNFKGDQPLVDSAYIAEALLRAPEQLWKPLSAEQQAHVIAALKETRTIKPYNNNWHLFASMVEAAIWEFSGQCEMERLEQGIKKMDGWYLGDGTYGDGPHFHWDYYNSYVIQPMLLDLVRLCAGKQHPLGELYPKLLKRAQRYAEIQERIISPDGTFPVMGRSSVYRFCAFRHLSYMGLQKQLPTSIKPGATRAALTAVIRRMIEAPGTFDPNGWLQLGIVGHQPSARDPYNNTGSLYICTNGFLHLGLPASDPFWSEPATPWTQQRIWAGEDIPRDRYFSEP